MTITRTTLFSGTGQNALWSPAPASGDLLIATVRRAASADNTAITNSNGWTEATQIGPGVEASTKERAVTFYKVSTGTETVLNLQNMGSAFVTSIQVYGLHTSLTGGTWMVANSDGKNMLGASLSLASGAYAAECEECYSISHGTYSDGVTSGNEATGSGFWSRIFSDRHQGFVFVLPHAKTTAQNTATWVSDQRRAVLATTTFAYLIQPTVVLTPVAGEIGPTPETLTATLTGGNWTIERVAFREGTLGEIGTDTTSPYQFAWDVDAVGYGTYSCTARALFVYLGALLPINSAAKAYTYTEPPPPDPPPEVLGSAVTIMWPGADGLAWVELPGGVWWPSANGLTWVQLPE